MGLLPSHSFLDGHVEPFLLNLLFGTREFCLFVQNTSNLVQHSVLHQLHASLPSEEISDVLRKFEFAILLLMPYLKYIVLEEEHFDVGWLVSEPFKSLQHTLKLH